MMSKMIKMVVIMMIMGTRWLLNGEDGDDQDDEDDGDHGDHDDCWIVMMVTIKRMVNRDDVDGHYDDKMVIMAVIDLLCTLVGTLDPHEWWKSPSYLDSSTPSLRGLWQKRNLSFSSGRRGSCTCDGTMKIDIDTQIQRICYTVSFIDLNSCWQVAGN